MRITHKLRYFCDRGFKGLLDEQNFFTAPCLLPVRFKKVILIGADPPEVVATNILPEISRGNTILIITNDKRE